MLECFIEKRFQHETELLIETMNQIIEEYFDQGFTLTLRQLYYQLVARAEVENTERSYKRVGNILNKARLAGLIDWDAIEDRTRNIRGNSHWKDPAQIVQSCIEGYKIYKWADQPYAPEVWIEKEALIGVISSICYQLDVPFFACKGYVSQSEQYAAGQRFEAAEADGRTPILFHLGDHDPSGMDMTRDNADRLSMFARTNVEVRRLALNMDQIREFNPPPNPAKMTDTRYQIYRMQYGSSSWELDALEPMVIQNLIQTEIESIRDDDLWNDACCREENGREQLREMADLLEKAEDEE